MSVAAAPGRSNGLTGRQVVVTRAADQGAELDDALRRRGAEPLPYPCIAIALPEDTGPLDAALRQLTAGEFDWLVLTSRNAATVLAQRLDALGLGMPGADRLRLAAVGAATAEAAERALGLRASLVPGEFVAEALATALIERTQPGERILLCQADIARPALADALRSAGRVIAPVAAYRTVVGSGGVALPALLAARRVDAVTFTSASTVRNLLARLVAEGGEPAALTSVCVACLGPVTADAARQAGLVVAVLPAEHTIPALVEALEAHFSR